MNDTKPARVMLQPRKSTLRENLSRAADRMEAQQAEIADLNAVATALYRERAVLRKAALYLAIALAVMTAVAVCVA